MLFAKACPSRNPHKESTHCSSLTTTSGVSFGNMAENAERHSDWCKFFRSRVLFSWNRKMRWVGRFKQIHIPRSLIFFKFQLARIHLRSVAKQASTIDANHSWYLMFWYISPCVLTSYWREPGNGDISTRFIHSRKTWPRIEPLIFRTRRGGGSLPHRAIGAVF